MWATVNTDFARGNRSVSIFRAVKDTILSLQTPILSTDGHTMISQLPVPKGSLVVADFAACNVLNDIWGDDASEWIRLNFVSAFRQSVLHIEQMSTSDWDRTTSPGVICLVSMAIAHCVFPVIQLLHRR